MSVDAMWLDRTLADGVSTAVKREVAGLAGRVDAVEVHADPRTALADWRALAAEAAVTPYQTPEWLLPWIDTVGRSSGIAPMIVVARDRDGRAAAVLPLGAQRQGALTTGCFLGGKDSNFNLGLFAPGRGWSRPVLHDLLSRAAASSGHGIDLFAFRNQPHVWRGIVNPFLAFAHQPSPSFAYRATLRRDAEGFFRDQVSREGRKKLRQKTKRLRGMGIVDVIEATGVAETRQLLDAFMGQRAGRNAASGLPSDRLPVLRAFLDAAVGEGRPVSFYGLRCGGQIVATLGGVRHGDRFSGMLTSFTGDPDIARTSPGEQLLAEVIRGCCEAGLATFDLGIGEARYKDTFCPDAEPLFDCLVPLTARGQVVARAEGLRLQLKRAIKQSRWAWPLVQKLRRRRVPQSDRT